MPGKPGTWTVDVVIPAHNAGRFLRDALESVFAQTVPPGAVIVVDDASTDETEAVLAAYGDRVKVLRQDQARGASAARNRGIADGEGSLVGFLDADDAWEPEMIARQIAEFDRHPDLGLCFTGIVDCDDALRPNRPPRVFAARSGERMFDELYRQGFSRFTIAPSASFVRREALALSGTYDETILRKEDFEFALRQVMLHPVSCLPEPLVRRRWHTASVTDSTPVEEHLKYELLNWKRCEAAAHRHGVTLPFPVEERIDIGLRRWIRRGVRDGNWAHVDLYTRELMNRGSLRFRDRISFGLAFARRVPYETLRTIKRKLLGQAL